MQASELGQLAYPPAEVLPVTVRVGIVGTGENARDHGRACARLPQTELVAICDISQAAVDRFGTEFGVAGRYVALDDMLRGEQLDILVVSVWGIDHASATIAAAASGRVRSILVEKPIAMNADECQQMITAVRANGVLLMEGFKWRHDPQHMLVKEIVDSGMLGRVGSVHGVFTSPLTQYATPQNWRFDRQRGGGSVFDTASYLIHFSRFILEREPIRVYATRADPDASNVELSAAILLEFPGAVAQLTSSYDQGYCQVIQVLGTNGWLRMDLPFDSRSQRGREFAEREDLPATLSVAYNNFDTATYRFAPVDKFELQLMHLVDCLEGNAEPRISPDFSLGNMRVIDAIYASLDARLPVVVTGPE